MTSSEQYKKTFQKDEPNQEINLEVNSVALISITGMSCYENYSLEELRWNDYKKNITCTPDNYLIKYNNQVINADIKLNTADELTKCPVCLDTILKVNYINSRLNRKTPFLIPENRIPLIVFYKVKTE